MPALTVPIIDRKPQLRARHRLRQLPKLPQGVPAPWQGRHVGELWRDEGPVKRYLVRVVRTTIFDVEVDADAAHRAEHVALSMAATKDVHHTESSSVVRQVSDPWVYGWSGDDEGNFFFGRPDGYMETQELLVFKTSYGNVFSEKDVALLVERAEDCVGAVHSTWNGEGSNTLTIRLRTPFKKLSSKQVAHLVAPKGVT
jgi:hypothetical protein